ncbi:hypothetical protein HanXRQr2_Chr16g0755451 [Helianthus annuus]|nr:hypothetical protein HanXRQr2_Chr16g0755451 [Helianthus annuus]KAJ0821757.1 hypothetical protein HanPSC8_Chr16g0723981 [Helianthus annuus]
MTTIPRGRGKSSSYGRSQTPSYRGRGHNSANNNRQDMVLAQIGNRRLIASNIASSSNEVISSTNTGDIQINQNDSLYEKIMDLIKAQKEKEITKPPTYATTVQDNDEDDSWFITERQKKIIILNQEDIKLLDDPWVLMQKYLDPASIVDILFVKIYHHIFSFHVLFYFPCFMPKPPCIYVLVFLYSCQEHNKV